MANELVKKEENAMVMDDSQFQMYLDTAKFEHNWRIGNLFAKSDLVPPQFKGKPENCMLAFNMATRLRVDPVMLMQKTCVIQGRPSMEAQLVIALVNARGPFKGPIHWEMLGKGEDRLCTAYAIHKGTGQRCEATVTWKMVELEGWSKKAGSKWLTIPEQMFKYRSAVFLARLYCPEVILGFETTDEVYDTYGRKQETSEKVSGLEGRLSKKIESTVSDTEGPEAPDAPGLRQIDDLMGDEIGSPEEASAEQTMDEPQSKGNEDPEHQECRFLCNDCSFEDDHFAKIVKKGEFAGWKCIKCFSSNTVDRRPAK